MKKLMCIALAVVFLWVDVGAPMAFATENALAPKTLFNTSTSERKGKKSDKESVLSTLWERACEWWRGKGSLEREAPVQPDAAAVPSVVTVPAQEPIVVTEEQIPEPFIRPATLAPLVPLDELIAKTALLEKVEEVMEQIRSRAPPVSAAESAGNVRTTADAIDEFSERQFPVKERAIVELITNAMDAQKRMPAPKVVVTTTKGSVTVADEGTGMNLRTILKKLLEPGSTGKESEYLDQIKAELDKDKSAQEKRAAIENYLTQDVGTEFDKDMQREMCSVLQSAKTDEEKVIEINQIVEFSGTFGVGFYSIMTYLDEDGVIEIATSDGKEGHFVQLVKREGRIYVSITPAQLPQGTSVWVQGKIDVAAAKHLLKRYLFMNPNADILVDGEKINEIPSGTKLVCEDASVFISDERTSESKPEAGCVYIAVYGVVIADTQVGGMGLPKCFGLNFPVRVNMPTGRHGFVIDDFAFRRARMLIDSVVEHAAKNRDTAPVNGLYEAVKLLESFSTGKYRGKIMSYLKGKVETQFFSERVLPNTPLFRAIQFLDTAEVYYLHEDLLTNYAIRGYAYRGEGETEHKRRVVKVVLPGDTVCVPFKDIRFVDRRYFAQEDLGKSLVNAHETLYVDKPEINDRLFPYAESVSASATDEEMPALKEPVVEARKLSAMEVFDRKYHISFFEGGPRRYSEQNRKNMEAFLAFEEKLDMLLGDPEREYYKKRQVARAFFNAKNEEEINRIIQRLRGGILQKPYETQYLHGLLSSVHPSVTKYEDEVDEIFADHVFSAAHKEELIKLVGEKHYGSDTHTAVGLTRSDATSFLKAIEDGYFRSLFSNNGPEVILKIFGDISFSDHYPAPQIIQAMKDKKLDQVLADLTRIAGDKAVGDFIDSAHMRWPKWHELIMKPRDLSVLNSPEVLNAVQFLPEPLRGKFICAVVMEKIFRAEVYDRGITDHFVRDGAREAHNLLRVTQAEELTNAINSDSPFLWSWSLRRNESLRQQLVTCMKDKEASKEDLDALLWAYIFCKEDAARRNLFRIIPRARQLAKRWKQRISPEILAFIAKSDSRVARFEEFFQATAEGELSQRGKQFEAEIRGAFPVLDTEKDGIAWLREFRDLALIYYTLGEGDLEAMVGAFRQDTKSLGYLINRYREGLISSYPLYSNLNRLKEDELRLLLCVVTSGNGEILTNLGFEWPRVDYFVGKSPDEFLEYLTFLEKALAQIMGSEKTADKYLNVFLDIQGREDSAHLMGLLDVWADGLKQTLGSYGQEGAKIPPHLAPLRHYIEYLGSDTAPSPVLGGTREGREALSRAYSAKTTLCKIATTIVGMPEDKIKEETQQETILRTIDSDEVLHVNQFMRNRLRLAQKQSFNQYAFIREMLQNSMDAAVEAGVPPAQRLIDINTFTHQEGNQGYFAVQFKDTIGMGVKTALIDLLVPGRSTKKGVEELIGEFGQGFFTLLIESERVMIKTKHPQSDKTVLLKLTPNRDRRGLIKDVDVELAFMDEQVNGTQILGLVPDNLPELRSQLLEFVAKRYGGTIPSNEFRVNFNGKKINTKTGRLLFALPTQLGEIKIYDGNGDTFFTHNGLYLKEDDPELLSLIPLELRGALLGRGLIIDLPKRLKLTRDRSDFHDRSIHVPYLQKRIAQGSLVAAARLFGAGAVELGFMPYDVFEEGKAITDFSPAPYFARMIEQREIDPPFERGFIQDFIYVYPMAELGVHGMARQSIAQIAENIAKDNWEQIPLRIRQKVEKKRFMASQEKLAGQPERFEIAPTTRTMEIFFKVPDASFGSVFLAFQDFGREIGKLFGKAGEVGFYFYPETALAHAILSTGDIAFNLRAKKNYQILRALQRYLRGEPMDPLRLDEWIVLLTHEIAHVKLQSEHKEKEHHTAWFYEAQQEMVRELYHRRAELKAILEMIRKKYRGGTLGTIQDVFDYAAKLQETPPQPIIARSREMEAQAAVQSSL